MAGKQSGDRLGRFELSVTGRDLSLDGRPVELGWRAQEALVALLEAEGAVVSRDLLFERLWPGITVEDSSLTKVISELRRALAAGDPDREYVETVPGMGYRMAVRLEPAGTGREAAAPPPTRARWLALGALGALVVLVVLSFSSAPPSAMSEAEAEYHAGAELLNKQSWGPRQQSIPHFRRAVELEPGHARAHAGLAFAMMGAKGQDAAIAAARKSVELDADCAPCQAILGYALEVVEWDWRGSREHLERAVALDPEDARSRRWYSHSLAVNGDLEEALIEAERAIRLAPYEAGPLVNKAVVLYLAERYEESITAADAAIAVEYASTGAWEFRSKALFRLGRHEEALGDVFRQWEPWRGLLKPTMARLEQEGWRAALEGFLAAPNSSRRTGNNPYHRAWWFALLDRPDEAVEELGVGLELRPYNMVYVAVDPGFESLRSRPDFESVLNELRRGATTTRTALR